MALGVYTPPNPFATTPDPGSLWDLIGQIAGNQAVPATPAPTLAAVANPLPTISPPTSATPDKAWYQKISNPFEPAGNPWVEALRQFGLNMPFSSRLFTGQRGLMNMGQLFGPLVQQGQKQADNRRLWGAFRDTPGLLPQGMDVSALESAGIDPQQALALMKQTDQGVLLSDIPGAIEMISPDATPEERVRVGAMRIPRSSADDYIFKIAQARGAATSLRREFEAAGIPAEQVRIGSFVDPGTMPTYRQQLKEMREQKEQERLGTATARQYESITGRRVPEGVTDPKIIGGMINDFYRERSQQRSHDLAAQNLNKTMGAVTSRFLQGQENIDRRILDAEQRRLAGESRAAVGRAEGEILRDVETSLRDVKKNIAELKASSVSLPALRERVQPEIDELEFEARELTAKKKKIQEQRLKGRAGPAQPEVPASSTEGPDLFDRYE